VLGIVGAIAGGWVFNAVGMGGVTGPWSAAVAQRRADES
jgi:uncharacterized membrane protein YeaQ/YmgE (transglycosylase-associated protein family)